MVALIHHMIDLHGELTDCVELVFLSDPKIITTLPDNHIFCPGNASTDIPYECNFTTLSEGITTISVTAYPPNILSTKDAFVSLSVKKKTGIATASVVFGWIYTVAWDFSFLPQIIHNWRRQSVIGLSFDFLVLNLLGFTCYFFFNMSLCWIDVIQDQYYERHPSTVLHVKLNDVIFPLYACVCTFTTIIQCFIYERGNQRVSTACRAFIALLLVSIGVYAILVGTVDSIWWIDFLYWLSYIKLAITCIKYSPQLYINYMHKSTEGWSIWQVTLDFTGGTLSLVQMFLLAYNYDDFHSVLSDPSKLGLGLLSIFFNILFFIQHYCLYRNNVIVKPDENSKPLEETKDVKNNKKKLEIPSIVITEL